MKHRCFICLILVAAGRLCFSPLAADEWRQFRGENASGVAVATSSLPAEFSYQDKVRWSAVLGDGIASPVIAAGRLFVTEMVGTPGTAVGLGLESAPGSEQKFAVRAFDATTGQPLWKREFETGPLPAITPPNHPASSTPATDGQRVYVYFSTLGLLALDAAEGRELWRHSLPVPAYLMDWGAAASPIVYRDMVIFNQDDDLSPFLLALDAATGEVRWRTPRPDMLAGYALPVLCGANGRTDLVVAGTGKLKGYDPETGKELWTCNTLLRTIMTSPVVRDGVVYISVQSYGDTERILKYALLEWKDTNQDGKLIKAELPKEFWEKFDKADANGDAFLEGDEIDQAFQSPDNMVGGGSIIQAIRGGGEGDVTATHLLWSLENRSPSNLASPLVTGDRLYVVKRGGLASCFESADGKSLWEVKRIGNLGDYYASPVAADGKIYIAGENGFVVVLAEGPELKVLAKNDMGAASCVATPAIAGGSIYVRTREKLFCVGE